MTKSIKSVKIYLVKFQKIMEKITQKGVEVSGLENLLAYSS